MRDVAIKHYTANGQPPEAGHASIILMLSSFVNQTNIPDMLRSN